MFFMEAVIGYLYHAVVDFGGWGAELMLPILVKYNPMQDHENQCANGYLHMVVPLDIVWTN